MLFILPTASDKDTMDTGSRSYSDEGNGSNVAQVVSLPPDENMSAKLIGAAVQATSGKFVLNLSVLTVQIPKLIHFPK